MRSLSGGGGGEARLPGRSVPQALWRPWNLNPVGRYSPSFTPVFRSTNYFVKAWAQRYSRGCLGLVRCLEVPFSVCDTLTGTWGFSWTIFSL